MFEFDAEKSEANKTKHGIDFIETQKIWEDENSFSLKAQYDDEERYLLIGKFRQKIWTVIYTKRGKNNRIISARRARKNEEKLYNSYRT